MQPLRTGALLLAGWAVASAAAAQTGASSSLIIDRNRADRLAPPALAPVERELATPADVETEGVAGMPIKRIAFDNVEVPERVAEAAKAFLGEPASKATLLRLARAMSDAYARTHVALYTVVVPAQDLSSGVVHIAVAEGFLENVVIAGQTKGHDIELIKHYAAQLTRERPLSRPVLERYLSLIRDIPGLTVDAQMLRGQKPGGVVLVLTLKFRKAGLTGGYDNRGSQLLGSGEFQATVKLYRLFRQGDETDITGAAASDLRRYRYIGLSHSTPIGDNGMRLTLSGGYLTTRPRHSDLRGTATTLGATLSYPVIRGYRRNLVASIGIDGLNSDNAALGSLIATERTRALRVAVGYSDATPKRVIGLSAAVSQGLDILGARVTQPLSDKRFTKATAQASLDHQIGKHFIARAKAIGQYSQDPLPAAERLAIGGEDYGRAFETAIVTGDRGYAGSFELAWRPDFAKNWDATELYGYVDGAKVHLVRRDIMTPENFDLASAGAGVRLAYRQKASIDVELGHSLDDPYPGYHASWQVSVGWKLDLGH